MSESLEIEIGRYCKLQGGYAFKSGDFADFGIPVVKIGNIQNQSATLENSQCLPLELYNEKLEKFKLFNGDILIAMTGAGSVGRVGRLVCSKNSFGLLNQRVGRFDVNENYLNREFLYYTLIQKKYQEALFLAGSGSGQPNLSSSQIESFKIEIPPLPEQKAIAHILGTLDEKMELNRQMNQTLEAMAQGLFKSWFVDFDPVIDNTLLAGNKIPEELQARAEKRRIIANREERSGKQSQSTLKPLLHTNPSLAAQFPASFVFNETLGKWIPERWEVKKVEEIATVVGGGTPSTKFEEYFTDNGIPWLSPKDLSGYEWKFIRKGATDITELGLKNSGAKLMPAGSVLFSSRAPIGYMAIAENEICTNQGFKSLVPDKGVPTEYLYQLLKSNADKIEAVATGSTFKEVSGSALKGIEVLIPSEELFRQFSQILNPSNKRQLRIQKETETLIQLRDRLLPELISGRVRLANFNHYQI